MGKIFCILGKSGAGKDTVFQGFLSKHSDDFRPIVEYTTRPKRPKEINGKSYYFVAESIFSKLREKGKIVEERVYQTTRGVWRYATVDDGKIDFSIGNYLTITTPPALAALRSRFGDHAVIALYLEVEDGLRLKRLIHREEKSDAPDYAELCRRFLSDERDFSISELGRYRIKYHISNRKLADCIRCIEKIVNEVLSK